MKLTVHVMLSGDDDDTEMVVREVFAVQREALTPDTLGLEVIAGKAVPAHGRATCFGYVQTYDTKPKRRLFEVLKAQGMTENQQSPSSPTAVKTSVNCSATSTPTPSTYSTGSISRCGSR